MNNIKENEIVVAYSFEGDSSTIFATQDEGSLGQLARAAVEDIAMKKLSDASMNPYSQKCNLAIAELLNCDNEFRKVDTEELSDCSDLFFFKKEVFSCSGACELKQGDSVILFFPPLCMEELERCCKEPSYAVAIKYDEYFESKKACKIYLANTSYPYSKKEKRECLADFENILWDKLIDKDQHFFNTIEFVLVKFI